MNRSTTHLTLNDQKHLEGMFKRDEFEGGQLLNTSLPQNSACLYLFSDHSCIYSSNWVKERVVGVESQTVCVDGKGASLVCFSSFVLL